jgi:uncharacterized protein YjiS (DUF1127 family)
MMHQVSAPQVDAELDSYAYALLQTDKEPSKYPVRRPECPRDASRWGDHFSFFVGNFCEVWTRGDRMYCCAAPSQRRVQSRFELERLSERDLADMKLTRLEIFHETQKPFWQE